MRGIWAAMALILVFALTACVFFGCKDDDDPVLYFSSRAYKGHEGDIDMNNFAFAYPDIVGTRLDDCQTCHTGGEAIESDGGGSTELVYFNPCSWCHLIPFDSDVIEGTPLSYQDTLNPYGLAYKNAGRTVVALQGIEDDDSDSDTYSNIIEIDANRYPGDPDSNPGLPVAPIYTMTWSDITSATAHTQFMLMNAHKQPNDTYDTYIGVKVIDLLLDAGVDLTSATGVTFISADGYAKDFTMSDIENQYPDGLYYADLDPDGFVNPDHGFVSYPSADQMPAGLTDGGTIPHAMWLILAYKHNGTDLESSYLDPITGKINGEGPYRNIVPQSTPGSPDRGSKEAPIGDSWDYDDLKDHNAGLCVKGVVAIRVNPMPSGLEEFDWKNAAFGLIQDKKLIIYGEGVTGN